jgi:DNA-binding response OmpR family regulator
MMAHILIVEDDAPLRETLLALLAEDGHEANGVGSASQAVESAIYGDYDAVVLDLGLPDATGYDVLRELRASGSSVPVLVLTARDHIDDMVLALDVGADDYLLKPFAPVELSARIRAVVRRGYKTKTSILSFNNLSICLSKRRVWNAGTEEEIAVSRREFSILEAIIQNGDGVFPKDRLMAVVFGHESNVMDNALEVTIARLRKKISRAGVKISSVYGSGYRLA